MGFNGTQALRLGIDDDVEDYPENKLHGFIVQLQCCPAMAASFFTSVVLCFLLWDSAGHSASLP